MSNEEKALECRLLELVNSEARDSAVCGLVPVVDVPEPEVVEELLKVRDEVLAKAQQYRDIYLQIKRLERMPKVFLRWEYIRTFRNTPPGDLTNRQISDLLTVFYIQQELSK